jgi:alpha-L-rhamnosidase
MQELRQAFITSTQNYMEGAVNLFEQRFAIEEISEASLKITALGLYEAEINGCKVGNQLFTPGYTYYTRNLHYQEYDVTKMINKGENSLRVFLAQGWYCGRFTHENKIQIYGIKPLLPGF